MNTEALEVPAISVNQPIGEFFLCAIPADILLQVAYSIPATMTREKGMFSQMFGTQRVQSRGRAKQIGAYIDEDNSTFPNTIILSVNYRENGDYEEDASLQWHASRTEGGCPTLVIPSRAKLASIIDGQHRLQGFNAVEKGDRLKMALPCAVFINLPRPYQARIFATININQKRVDKSLAYELFGYDLNESNPDHWPPDMLGVYLARILEGKDGSPFKGHVRLALLEEDAVPGSNDLWQVSVACLVEGISRLISSKPADDKSALASGKIKDRSGLAQDSTPLRAMYTSGQDKTLLELITDYFAVLDRLLWAGQPPGTFITRTVGILAQFDVLRDALKKGQVVVDDVWGSTERLFQNIAGFDFSDDYFHASGAGRVRIRKVISFATKLIEEADDETKGIVNKLSSATKLKGRLST